MTDHTPFAIRGFNMCESLLRHTPEELTRFLRRMKTLDFNSAIIHYDYGFRCYRDLILRETRAAGVDVTLMTFGPRTFYGYFDWDPAWAAKDEAGKPFCNGPECELQGCGSNPEAVEVFYEGAKKFLKELPPGIRRVNMRAGDGTFFCRCPKCRALSESDRHQPFADAFLRAWQEVRPDLLVEGDVYYLRYALPTHSEGWGKMDRIMFDTFPRLLYHPIGEKCSVSAETPRSVLDRGAVCWGEHESPAMGNLNEYLRMQQDAWNRRFPGSIYVFENVMKQGYTGIDMRYTQVLLEDIKRYREMGLSGMLFEAFEPGYRFNAGTFEVLAKVLKDPASAEEYVPTPLEKYLRETAPQDRYHNDPAFDAEKWIEDPLEREHVILRRELEHHPSAAAFRAWVGFSFEHKDELDALYVTKLASRIALASGKVEFRTRTEHEAEFFRHVKLWDFMEELDRSGADAYAETTRTCEGLMACVADK